MAKLAYGWQFEVLPKVRALDEDRVRDILSEIVYELTDNERSSDSERIKAIADCFDFVLGGTGKN